MKYVVKYIGPVNDGLPWLVGLKGDRALWSGQQDEAKRFDRRSDATIFTAGWAVDVAIVEVAE